MDSEQAHKQRSPTKILIADSAAQNLELLKAVFSMAGYDVAVALDGEEALLKVDAEKPDLVILEVLLAGVDGFEVCSRLKAREKHWGLPVVLISSHQSSQERIRGIEAGASDYWHRPLHRADILARAKAILRSAHSRRSSSVQHAIVALAKAVEARDPYTRGHGERVADLAVMLGKAMNFEEIELGYLKQGALLHDVGKVGIRDSVLLKIGELDDHEKGVIQGHARIGETICQPLRSRTIMDIVRSHHERWDGSGYPDGLAGEAIPVVARILAIADAYDAMTSNRPYRLGRSRAKALQIIAAESGRQFDPVLTAMFCEAIKTAPRKKRNGAPPPNDSQMLLLPEHIQDDRQSS